MYGLIGRFSAATGKREELISILLNSIEELPGCLSYIVARDPKDADAVWVTEVWDTAESHKASLLLPSVRAAITQARPIIAALQDHIETEPVGGLGLRAPSA